jgi:hypothetical protein
MYPDDFSFLNLLFWSILIGLIPAAIAHNKGQSFLGWWIFGAALFIIALPAALILKPDAQQIERLALSSGGRKCPHCTEIIKREAKVCRFCGRDLEPLPDPNNYSALEKQIDISELDETEEDYYKTGLGFMDEGLYDEAKLEFLKAIRVSVTKGKWYSSSQARLMEIRAKGI